MKKCVSLFLATVVTAAVLTGCGSNGTISGTSGTSGSSGSSTSGSGSSTASSIVADSSVGYPDSDGYAEGRLGDVMHTYFFDYTVNSAYLCDEYAGHTAQDGYELLVADLTVKNTTRESIEMYDTDFQIQWNEDADDAFDFSLTAYDDEGKPLDDKMLPGIYTLAVNESVNGLLVCEVPAGHSDFSISYQEQFSDNTTGDMFFVFFSASKQ